MWIFLIIVAFYFIGSIIYCILNKHRVGEENLDYDGCEITEPQDIAFEALLWPVYLSVFMVLSPYLFLVKLIELLCGQKRN